MTDAHTTLLERDQEVRTLDGLLAEAEGGGSGLVVVEGPAGIGKSRLIGELRAIASRTLWLTSSAGASSRACCVARTGRRTLAPQGWGPPGDAGGPSEEDVTCGARALWWPVSRRRA